MISWEIEAQFDGSQLHNPVQEYTYKSPATDNSIALLFSSYQWGTLKVSLYSTYVCNLSLQARFDLTQIINL